jgi:hypothetical protein
MSRLLRDITLPMFGAFFAGVAATVVVIWYCLQSGDPLLGLLALVGAIFGWITGVLAVPYSSTEKQHFGELAKVISGFVTGYLLSKVDPLINASFAVPREGALPPLMEAPFAEQVLILLASFGIALLFVFNARLYWSPEAIIAAKKARELDAWIAAQKDPKPSRVEAIERLVNEAMGAEGKQHSAADAEAVSQLT